MKEIRLDKNELPYLPPEDVLNAISSSVEKINRYSPQEEVDKLQQLLSEYNNIPKESIILSPGSDILIKELIFLLGRNRNIIICDPTFIVIQNAIQKMDSSLLKVKLSAPKFKFPTYFVQEEISEPTLVVIDNPNNPTGKVVISKEEIKSLLENENVLIIIDEAYFEFSDYTVAPLVKEHRNLGVLRTLSKSFGLAGASCGYMIAGGSIEERLSGLEVMLPYPSVLGSIAALRNKAYFQHLLEKVEREKIRVLKEIEQCGITVYPSRTNFLLMATEIPDITQELSKRGVYVFDASNYFTAGYIRVSIGTREENNAFISNLKEIISHSK